MSFGFGIGDFLTVLELAKRLRKDFSRAPEQYKGISAEIENVSLVLEGIENDFSRHELSDIQKQNLSDIAATVIQVLKDAERILGKYSKLDSKQPSLKGQIGRIKDRLSLDNEDIRDLRLRLVSTLKALNSFTDRLDRKVLTNLVTNQVKTSVKQNQLQNREILEWLAPVDYASQHLSIRDRCLPDSGRWVLESSEYQQWLRGEGELLFLQGMPGTGKTFISAIIIESIQRSPRVGLCYYYCDYNRSTDGQLCKILAWFLRQLAHESIHSSIESMFEQQSKDGSRPSLQSIRDILYLVVKDFETIWLVVDALDEYSDALQRLEFVRELLYLNKMAKVNLLITSRPLPDISKHFAHGTSFEVQARDEDISSYIAANIPTLPNFVIRDPSLQKAIRDSIIEVVDGIFLLVALNLQSLRGIRSKGHLEKALNSFKKGTSGYQDAYSKTMERISRQDQGGLAIDALTWIVYAARPLKTPELLHALATEINASEFNEHFIPDIDDILDACCGLIHIENESEIVRLIHRTTVEFLKGEGAIWLTEGHTKLSDVCNTYLTFSGLNKLSLEESLKRYPLHNYASWYWQYHAEKREQPIDMEQFASKQQQITESSLDLIQKAFPEYLSHSHIWPGITGLHLAAVSGLVDLVPTFLRSYDVDAKDRYQKTPVAYAVQQGHYDTLRVLIESNAILDFVYETGETLLTYAILLKRDGILSILARSGSPQLNLPNKQGCTPLHLAAMFRNVFVVRTLLEAGANPNIVDIRGCTPLLYAVESQYSSYSPTSKGENSLSYDLGVKPNIPFKDRQFFINIMKQQNTTCADDYESIVELLIMRGADSALADRYHRTPIWYAHTQCNHALLAHIYKCSMRNRYDLPLDNASRLQDTAGETIIPPSNGNLNTTTAHVPLDLSVCVDMSTRRTILHTAVKDKNMNMLKWLCDKTRNDISIPSHEVLLYYESDRVQFLPEVDWLGVTEVPERLEGKTWFYASLRGSLRVLKMLIRHQALHQASSQPGFLADTSIEHTNAKLHEQQEGFPVHTGVLQRNDWLHVVDEHGQNALHLSIMHGNVAAAKYLLEHGVDRYARDNYGRTILEYACLHRTVESIWVPEFLDNIDVRQNTWSPLHWVCRAGSNESLLLLAKAGCTASVVSTSTPAMDWMPMDIAVFFNNPSFLTADASLVPDVSWESLIESGLVYKDESRGAIVPNYKSVHPRSSHNYVYYNCAICNGGFICSPTLVFKCITCLDKVHCLFCKHDGESLHLGHEWAPYNPLLPD